MNNRQTSWADIYEFELVRRKKHASYRSHEASHSEWFSKWYNFPIRMLIFVAEGVVDPLLFSSLLLIYSYIFLHLLTSSYIFLLGWICWMRIQVVELRPTSLTAHTLESMIQYRTTPLNMHQSRANHAISFVSNSLDPTERNTVKAMQATS